MDRKVRERGVERPDNLRNGENPAPDSHPFQSAVDGAYAPRLGNGNAINHASDLPQLPLQADNSAGNQQLPQSQLQLQPAKAAGSRQNLEQQFKTASDFSGNGDGIKTTGARLDENNDKVANSYQSSQDLARKANAYERGQDPGNEHAQNFGKSEVSRESIQVNAKGGTSEGKPDTLPQVHLVDTSASESQTAHQPSERSFKYIAEMPDTHLLKQDQNLSGSGKDARGKDEDLHEWQNHQYSLASEAGARQTNEIAEARTSGPSIEAKANEFQLNKIGTASLGRSSIDTGRQAEISAHAPQKNGPAICEGQVAELAAKIKSNRVDSANLSQDRDKSLADSRQADCNNLKGDSHRWLPEFGRTPLSEESKHGTRLDVIDKLGLIMHHSAPKDGGPLVIFAGDAKVVIDKLGELKLPGGLSTSKDKNDTTRPGDSKRDQLIQDLASFRKLPAWFAD